MTRIALLALLSLGTSLTQAPAQTAADVEAGRAEYMIACAVCHGESALGDGPFAEVLNIAVPGLTDISARNDGIFPFLETFMIIDGRTMVRGHGSAMPIWGDRFASPELRQSSLYGAEMIVRGRILALAYYLESLQQ